MLSDVFYIGLFSVWKCKCSIIIVKLKDQHVHTCTVMIPFRSLNPAIFHIFMNKFSDGNYICFFLCVSKELKFLGSMHVCVFV